MSKQTQRRTSAIAVMMLAIAVGWLGEPSPASAQIPPGAETEKLAKPKPVDPDLISPRATLRTFIRGCASGNTAAAIKCLQLTPAGRLKGEVYAFRLKDTIDRTLLVNYRVIPDNPDYDQSVDFRGIIEQLGGPTAHERLSESDLDDVEKIVIARQKDGSWQFTAETIAAIDDIWERWNDVVPDEGVEEAEQPLPRKARRHRQRRAKRGHYPPIFRRRAFP